VGPANRGTGPRPYPRIGSAPRNPLPCLHYCRGHYRIVEGYRVEGLYWTNKKTGEPKEHPAAKRMDALRRDYLKALTMLGLRASVAVPEEVKHETLEDILNGC
jgi:phage terminase small subunit